MSPPAAAAGPSTPAVTAGSSDPAAPAATAGQSAPAAAVGQSAPAAAAGPSASRLPVSARPGRLSALPSGAAELSAPEAAPSATGGIGARLPQGASRSGTEPDPHREARRARPRVSATSSAPSALHGEIVKCLREIGDAASGADDNDQLFCNSIAGELRKRTDDENRRIKGEICRILYG